MEKKIENNRFNFWQDHSLHYLEMAYRTDKIERVENCDGYGKRTGQCGDTIEIFLTVRDEIIRSASFTTDGCLNTIACANTVIHLAENKSVEDTWEISAQSIIDYLGTLPSTDRHCAELAVGALYKALSDFQKVKQNSWKKIYKKH